MEQEDTIIQEPRRPVRRKVRTPRELPTLTPAEARADDLNRSMCACKRAAAPHSRGQCRPVTPDTPEAGEQRG